MVINKVALRHQRKLRKGGYHVEIPDEHDLNKFYVLVTGPNYSPYSGGVWVTRVELPMDYPIKPPAVYFINTIYHPNISPLDGRLHLDVLDKSWKTTSDLNNIFDTFIPGALSWPDDSNPSNFEAAAQWKRDWMAYVDTVEGYIYAYAWPWPYVVAAAPQEPMLDDNHTLEATQIAPQEPDMDDATANP